MIKLFGFIITVFAFLLLGKKVSYAKRSRLTYLEDMRLSLADYKAAINVFSLPVPEALNKSGISEKGASFINEEDEKDFNIFMKGTKAETVDGQLSNITGYEKKMESEENAERAKYASESHLIKGGFVLAGILLALLLL